MKPLSGYTNRDGLREVVARGEGRREAVVLAQRVLEHRLPLLKPRRPFHPRVLERVKRC